MYIISGIKQTGTLNLATSKGRMDVLRRQQAIGRCVCMLIGCMYVRICTFMSTGVWEWRVKLYLPVSVPGYVH